LLIQWSDCNFFYNKGFFIMQSYKLYGTTGLAGGFQNTIKKLLLKEELNFSGFFVL